MPETEHDLIDPEPVRPAPKVRPKPINMDVVLLDVGGGVYDELPVMAFARRRQQIHVGPKAVAWCHVGEDRHGRWTYRRV